MIARLYLPLIREKILQGKKIVLVFGPRQAGKTTLVREACKQLNFKTLEINADQSRYIDVFSSRDLDRMKNFVQGYDVLFLDEAQRIPEIGINLKILHDQMPELRVVATGSSSFDLANQTREPLTGRTATFTLLPIGVCELMQSQTPFELMGQIESFLLYGMYPERFSLTHRDELIAYLAELSSAYLYKDVLELANIRYSSKIFKLLQLLAFQIGSEVSLIELSRSLEMSKETVSHYLDLLEQSFVLFRLSGFSRNLRKEVTRMDKIYFWDTGIRNALIDNFLPLAHRNDKGALWENFLIAERIKMRAYRQLRGRSYFWRTYDQSEVDYVEETDGQLKAFEFKFQPQPIKPPQAFLNHYPDAVFSGVHTENFLSFLE